MTQLDEAFRAVWRDIANLVTRTERLETQESKVLGCRVISTSTSQNILASSLTALSFTSSIADTNSMFSTAAPTRLTASVPGYYVAGGAWSIQAANVTTGTVVSSVRYNGADYLDSQRFPAAAGETVNCNCVTGMFHMSSGDYVEIMAFHSMSTTKNIQAASTGNQQNCLGWLVKIL